MVESYVSISRKFTANACLYRDVGLPKRFLRRNLRTILDSHERSLHWEPHHISLSDQKPDDASSEDMIANERRAAGWDYPTKEMLDDLTKGDKPVLQLAGLRLRHSKAKSRKRKRSPRDDTDHHPDWLPDPGAAATWACQVCVNVREKDTSKRSLYAESRHATVSQFPQSDGEPNQYEISIAKPFLIEVDKLFVAVETGTNGFRHWRRTVAANYNIEITLQCGDSDDTADFFSELESQPRAKYEQLLGHEGIVRAVWDELPKCPDAGRLLPLKRAKGHSVVTSEYEMELSMGWKRKRESPLQMYNKVTAEGRGGNRQLLTPLSEDTEQATRHVITYKFCEGLTTRSRRVDGLDCPLCREQPKTFPRLLLHCSTFHDHFRFEVDESQHGAALDPAVISKTVLLTVSPQLQYEKVTEQGADEGCNWVAPEKPFDLRAHLRGDQSWTGFSRPKAAKKRGRQGKAQQQDANPVIGPRPLAKRATPQEVQDLPQNGHKRHMVPDVPGVRFYHSLSKKAIEPGEIVSDSDESVDEFWMMDVQRLALKELSINGAAQDFAMEFNRHLAREQSTSSLLMKEAVVRFTRLHRKELKDVGWQRPFRKKLEQLQGAGVISRATITHCIQLLQKEKAGEDVEMINGVAEARAAEGEKSSNGQLNGSVHRVPDGMRVGSNLVLEDLESRTPSVEPGGRGTPFANGTTKEKERVRWGLNTSVGRNSIQPSPSIECEVPSGIPVGTNGKPNGVDLNGDIDIDVEIQSRINVASSHGDLGKKMDKQNGLCVCGKSARDKRAAVICSNLKCRRRDFHLACVGLERRQPGWKCQDCTANTTP